MLKSELKQKYQNMLEIAVNLKKLKNAYKEKCELLEKLNKSLKQQNEDLKILLVTNVITNN